jgi:putative acetyltransferase
MKISRETPKQPDIIAMLDELDAYCGALYPAESNHLMDVNSLTRDDVVFLVARDARGTAVGCGAYVNRGSYGEVKRMFVAPSQRGLGVGGMLLAEIARQAKEAGLSALMLETGIHQPEAIGLYERDGFSYCEPFGEYLPDPLSVFMEKAL